LGLIVWVGPIAKPLSLFKIACHSWMIVEIISKMLQFILCPWLKCGENWQIIWKIVVVWSIMIFYSMFTGGNSNTSKLSGVQVKLPTDPQHRNKIISYVISAFSFNLLPINYVEIFEDPSNKNNISFSQKCYIKSGETYFSKSTTVFSTISKVVDLDELGLVATGNLIPQVLRKRPNITCELPPYPCLLSQCYQPRSVS